MSKTKVGYSDTNNFIVLKRLFRKRSEDESVLWEKVCPKCGAQSMIARWDWKLLKYADLRCQTLVCTYGNI